MLCPTHFPFLFVAALLNLTNCSVKAPALGVFLLALGALPLPQAVALLPDLVHLLPDLVRGSLNASDTAVDDPTKR